MDREGRWILEFSSGASKDWKIIERSPLKEKATRILESISLDPRAYPSKQLSADLDGLWARRLNLQHRIVFGIEDSVHTVHIVSMWGHYDD